MDSRLAPQPLVVSTSYMSFPKVVSLIRLLKNVHAFHFKVRISSEDGEFITNIKKMIKIAQS